MPETTSLKLKIYVDGDEDFCNRYKKHIEKHNHNILLNQHPDSGFDLLCPEDHSVDKSKHSQLVDLGICAALFEESATKPVSSNLISACLISMFMLLFYSHSWYYITLIVVGTSFYIYCLDESTYISIITENPYAYQLLPRSSTGSKTPLRLANSVGVIDSGYRGHLMACVDNVNTEQNYEIKKEDRLFQIVAFNGKPMFVTMVASHDDLQKTTRNNGGFGSTGR